MPANLLPPDAKKQAAQSGYRRTAYLITTTILVAYLVIVAGLGGWWLFLSDRQVKLSDEVIALSGQVQKKADLEASIRHQAVRIDNIEKFLNNQISFAKMANTFLVNSTNVSITGWSYALSGKHTLELTASDSASLETYLTNLKPSFPNIVVDTLIRKTATTWEASVNLQDPKTAEK